jgi:tetratricopeptide (TPR) repeat protein
MDTKHRHELEQNDLASFIVNFQAFWAKHGNKVLTVVLVVLAFFVVKRLLDQNRESQQEGSWADLATTSSPDGFAEVARKYEGTPVEAIAYLNAGDLLLRKAAIPEAPTTAPATQEADDPTRALEQAESYYRKAQSAEAVSPIVKLNALLGLASVAESRGQIDEAKKLYQQVIDQAQDFHSIRTQAEARLALADNLARPIVFGADEPRPSGSPGSFLFDVENPTPTTRPATAPATQPR